MRQKDKHLRNIHGNHFTDQTFKKKLQLKSALETMSKETAEYIETNFNMACDACETMFDSFSHAKAHYLTEHNEPKGYVRCCDIKMKTLLAIDEHIRWHQNPETMK